MLNKTLMQFWEAAATWQAAFMYLHIVASTYALPDSVDL